MEMLTRLLLDFLRHVGGPVSLVEDWCVARCVKTYGVGFPNGKRTRDLAFLC